MPKLYNVACQVVVRGNVQVIAGGSRSAAKKARMILTTSNNAWSHLSDRQAPIVDTAPRGEEVILDDVSTAE